VAEAWQVPGEEKLEASEVAARQDQAGCPHQPTLKERSSAHVARGPHGAERRPVEW
jgi:hypothetical protein